MEVHKLVVFVIHKCAHIGALHAMFFNDNDVGREKP
jgi:hypothetical protein